MHALRLGLTLTAYSLLITAVGLVTPLTQIAMAQGIPTGVGFTHIPKGQGHGSALCNQAAWLNPQLPNPSFHDFKFRDPHFTDHAGTQFVRWLRGGQRAIFLRVSWHGAGSCSPSEPCCTIPIPQTAIDNFIVDLNTGAIASSPTTKFRELQGHNQAYFYNEGLQPLYAKGTNRLTGFVLVTHRDLTTSSSAEIWQIKPDGTPVKRLIPQDVGSHGCGVSPDEQYLACERMEPEWDQKGFLLAKIDGTQVADVKWKNLYMPIGAPSWSSDSAGFAFYACKTADPHSCNDGGNLVYYDITKKIFTPLAPDFSPAFFCLYASCRPSGAHGSEIPARSPVHGWFYYSVLIGSTNGGMPRRVLGSVSRDNPKVFHPLTFGEFTEPGHPVVSSNNKTVAFIANFSESDTRAALFSVDVRTQIVRRVGSLLSPGDSIYAPEWHDWPLTSGVGSRASGTHLEVSEP
jgi:hypothetical protein